MLLIEILRQIRFALGSPRVIKPWLSNPDPQQFYVFPYIFWPFTISQINLSWLYRKCEPVSIVGYLVVSSLGVLAEYLSQRTFSFCFPFLKKRTNEMLNTILNIFIEHLYKLFLRWNTIRKTDWTVYLLISQGFRRSGPI